MTTSQIKETLSSPEYSFLRENEHLGKRIILIALGGSHAYGTNVETSDLDVRGCALNTKEEILTNKYFEQVVNTGTDTTIYSFTKLVRLLTNINPNTIEILGCKPEHYIYLSPIGTELLANKDIFLSKQCIHTFGGYAYEQLRRLDNKAARLVGQAEQERHILNSISNAKVTFPERYFSFDDDSIDLYVDESHREGYESEIYMDINLKHYPLRDFKGMWSDMNNIVKDYAKIGGRNSKAIEHGKLAKHMMHLVRLYYICFDILERGEINTYREKEHDFLMSIRNGDYLDENRQPTQEFFDIVNELKARLERLKNTTEIPEKPDMKKIEKFVMSVNERVVLGEV